MAKARSNTGKDLASTQYNEEIAFMRVKKFEVSQNRSLRQPGLSFQLHITEAGRSFPVVDTVHSS